MTDDAQTRRRRAVYRASHRGTKEMDWVLGRFAEQALADMAGARLATFEELLELPDPMLHEMLMDGVPVADAALAALVAEIRTFHGLGGGSVRLSAYYPSSRSARSDVAGYSRAAGNRWSRTYRRCSDVPGR